MVERITRTRVSEPARRVRSVLAAGATRLVWGLFAGTMPVALAADLVLPDVQVQDPPTFGFQVGDVAQRHLQIRLPEGARFDASSLPPPTRQGAALELSSVRHQGEADAAEQAVLLRYQIFRSPPTPSVLEMPPLLLRFSVPAPGAPTGRRDMTVRVDAHPLMVSPLAPADPPNRTGLGPLQPDLPAPPVPTEGVQARLWAWLAAALLGAGLLAWRHGVQPVWQRQRRPFASAWRVLRRQLPASGHGVDDATLMSATRRLHAALRADAGRVLLAADVPGWLAVRPRYAALREPLLAFHQRSSQRFFAPDTRDTSVASVHAQDAAALRALSQALARAEAAP